MQALSEMFSSAASAVSGATGASATGSSGANSSKKNNSKVTGLGPEIAPGNTHVPNSTATGGMGTPSQRGGRCWKKNRSNKNRNRKNKTRKNRR